MILTQGQRYRATIRLGFFERIASNEAIESKLEGAGFIFVSVIGSGRERRAEGTWGGVTQDVDLPDQIVSSSIEVAP
jgi:hypothetical protein